MPPGVAPRCLHCAAPIADSHAERCSFCGNALAPAMPPPAAAHAAPRAPTVAELLAGVERYPEFQKWMAWTPSDLGVRVRLGLAMSFGIFVLVAAIALLFAAVPKEPAAVVISVVVLTVGLAITLTAGLRATSFARARLQRVPALVVDKRTKVSGGGNNSSASTTYYATLEQVDGLREEYEIDSKLSGSIAQGDIGLAFLRGGMLLDFKRAGSRWNPSEPTRPIRTTELARCPSVVPSARRP
jgi:hypothetical protein